MTEDDDPDPYVDFDFDEPEEGRRRVQRPRQPKKPRDTGGYRH